MDIPPAYKTCKTCSQDLPLDSFHPRKGAADGRRGQCKNCRRECERRNPEAFRALKRAQKRRWRDRHPDLYVAAKRRYRVAYREAHPELVREAKVRRQRALRLRLKPQREAKRVLKLEATRVRQKEQYEAWKKSPNYKLWYYKKAARDRAYGWELSDSEAEILFAAPCHWCGGPGFGIDRRNNEPYYRTENSVPCCTYCNRAKSDREAELFLQHCLDVVLHNNLT